jgi:soluble lytic murein transglycosylase
MSIDEVSAILAERMHAAPKDQVSELSKHLLSLCQKFRFDPAFILSVIQTESGFQSEALSPAGAVGLMQLMPATAQVVVRDMNPPLERPVAGMNQQLLMDPFINLTLGVTYLASLRDRYKTLHPYVVLAAYNLGPARIDELLSKKAFKPDKTKKYFEAIRQGTSQFRLYRAYRRPA